jgi:hypothetical protein
LSGYAGSISREAANAGHPMGLVNDGIEFNKLYNAQMRTELELQPFKDEMKAYKEEGRRQNREMNRRRIFMLYC